MKKIIIIITCFIGLSGAFAQQRGMFHNPVIEADVPDPSMIRVGNYYYLVSTTMHLMPGCPVMRSKDLVHWETISYVFQRLTDLPRYDLKEGTVYGRGQWASSLRYHDGRFYVWFSPNDEPHRGYIYTAEDPAGEWTLLSRPPHHHDASLFFDDDGQVYLFYGTGQLRQLKSDLSDVEPGGIDQKIDVYKRQVLWPPLDPYGSSVGCVYQDVCRQGERLPLRRYFYYCLSRQLVYSRTELGIGDQCQRNESERT